MSVTGSEWRIWRMVDAYGWDAAAEALARFRTAVATFEPEAATAAQVSLLRSEVAAIRRRLPAAQAEFLRERGELRASEAEHDAYAKVAGRLSAEVPTLDGAERKALATDLARLEIALKAARDRLVAERDADARSQDWLKGLSAATEEIEARLALPAQSVETGSGGAALIRAASRIAAALGAMLGEAEARRARTQEAITAARSGAFAAFEGDPRFGAVDARSDGTNQPPTRPNGT
jgi:hypothetical protein